MVSEHKKQSYKKFEKNLIKLTKIIKCHIRNGRYF